MPLKKETVIFAKEFFIASCAVHQRACRVDDPESTFRALARLSLDAAVIFEQELKEYTPFPEPETSDEPEAARAQ
jgi:hypothetical protein